MIQNVSNQITRKVLLVDDDAGTRDAIRLALEDQEVVRFNIYESAGCDEAIAMARRTMPDIIILDLNMPHKNGFDFMDQLQAEPQLRAARVIMLTALDTLMNVMRAINKNISPERFIGKPFNVSELQAVVYGASDLLSYNYDQ